MFSNSDSGRSRRREGRARVHLSCEVLRDGPAIRATVIDLSNSGAGLFVAGGAAGLDYLDRCTVSVDGLGRIAATVRWKTSDRFGVSFDDAEAAGALVDAFLKARGIAIEDPDVSPAG